MMYSYLWIISAGLPKKYTHNCYRILDDIPIPHFLLYSQISPLEIHHQSSVGTRHLFSNNNDDDYYNNAF